MGLELTIASRHDPHADRADRPQMSHTRSTSIALNGAFEQSDSQDLLRTIGELFATSDDSILVSMEQVEPADTAALQSFAAGIMLLRDAGRQIQVATHDASLHARLARIAHSRDWLVGSTSSDACGARRAIHLDGMSECGPAGGRE